MGRAFAGLSAADAVFGVMTRCPICATEPRTYMLIVDPNKRVRALHYETFDRRIVGGAKVCDEWNRFVDVDPEGKD